MNDFDIAEVQTDVTVQILTNSKTGETSIGWTRNMNMIEEMIRHAHYVNETSRLEEQP